MKFKTIAIAACATLLLYFLAWPVPIDPVAWVVPPNPGHVGPFAANRALANLELIDIGERRGPEDIARDAEGNLYTGTRDGAILRLNARGENPRIMARTGGQPLGLAFAPDGRLIVADALRGLLAIDSGGRVEVLADHTGEVSIGLADDVAIAPDGTIYVSDASTKFTAREYGDAAAASVLEILESRGTGRLLKYDPRTEAMTVLMSGLVFANGIELSASGDFLLLNESGRYRVHRYWLRGPRAGAHEVFLDALPAFPDNVDRDVDGLFWIALIAPRDAVVDALAGWPFLRRVVARLPAFLQPAPAAYLHVIAVDDAGAIVYNYQDPETLYRGNTAAFADRHFLFFGSLESPTLARIPRADLRRLQSGPQ